eukprot:jgi/Mesen1/4377/ME000222S03500
MEGERQLAHCREQIAQQEERMAHVAQMLTGTSGQRDVPAVAAPPPAPAGVALPHNLLSSPGQLHAGRQPAAPVPLLPVPLPAGTPAAAPPAPASPEPGGSRRHSSGSFSSPVRDLRAAAGPSPIENGFSSVDLPLRGPTGSPALPRAYGRDGGSSEKNGEGSSDGTLGPRAPLPPSRSVSIGDRSSFSASVRCPRTCPAAFLMLLSSTGFPPAAPSPLYPFFFFAVSDVCLWQLMRRAQCLQVHASLAVVS